MSDARTLRPFIASNWSADAAAEKTAELAGPKYLLVSWLVLSGLVIPAWEAQVQIAGAKMTVGRFAVTLLAIPALVMLFRGGRRFMVADFAAFAMSIWMVGAAAATEGPGALASPAAESMQFLFAFLVGRAFYVSPAALDSFIRVLMPLTFAMILIAVAERVTGRWLAHDIAASLFGTAPLSLMLRGNTIRATATLDHPILFGVFCALVNAIVLLWARGGGQRALLSVTCLTGCFLSQSSAALIAYVLGLAAYAYDRLLQNMESRWTVFWWVLGFCVGLVFLVTEHPIGWFLSHMTLDPESGYFRILIWDLALAQIGQSPITGYSFAPLNDYILDTTVDCVWLVEALRYGIPAIVLLAWANIAAIWPVRSRGPHDGEDFDRRMSLAFTIVLLLLVFSGITVHLWNYMWILWGLFIGIKASLRERAIAAASNE